MGGRGAKSSNVKIQNPEKTLTIRLNRNYQDVTSEWLEKAKPRCWCG